MIRFASIPKCASKTLKVQGLSGATMERPHMPITDFPAWESYQWHMVERDRDSWLASWWWEAKRAEGDFCRLIGMEFRDMIRDLKCLENPPTLPNLPRYPGFNSWIPSNFSEAYKGFNGDFHAFCISTITSGIECVKVKIENLSQWLIDHGYKPFTLNARSA